MATITDSKSAGEGVEKPTFKQYRWESKMVEPVWKTVWKFLNKLNTELSRDQPSDSTPRYVPRRVTDLRTWKSS